MKINLEGKTVLVTGGGRGIGLEIVKALIECGAHVIVQYNRSRESAEKLIREWPDAVVAIQGSLDNSDAVSKFFEEVMSRSDGLDALVNNAGIALETPLDVSEAQWMTNWNTTFQVNTAAAAQLSRMFVIHALQSGGGRLVNISSRAAHRGDTPEYMAYGASKAAMASITQTIARGYGKAGICAFNVAPGFVRTDMAQDFIDRYGEKYVASDLSVPDIALPKDIAPMVAFLLSGLADYANGATFDLNGGSYIR